MSPKSNNLQLAPLLATALLLSACGGTSAASKIKTDAPAATPPAQSFPVALAPFPRLKYKAPSGNSAFSAALGTETCAGTHHALQVEKDQLSYGDQFTACLDLDTGALTASAKSTLLPNSGSQPYRADFNETIAMPLTADHYFDYLNRLNEVTFTLSVLGQVAAYDALTQIATELKNSSAIDALALTNADAGYSTTTVNLSFNLKASTDRTLLVRFGDQQQVYQLQSFPIKSGDSQLTVTVTKPANFDYRDTASVQAYLVPKDGSAKDALRQVSQSLSYLSKESVQFWPLNTAVTLQAGQDNPIVIAWSVLKDRTVILRLTNEAGQLVSEQRVDAPAPGPGADQPPEATRAELNLALPASLPVGDHYTMTAHLVPQGGQWSDEIATYTRDKIIRVKKWSAAYYLTSFWR